MTMAPEIALRWKTASKKIRGQQWKEHPRISQGSEGDLQTIFSLHMRVQEDTHLTTHAMLRQHGDAHCH